MAEKEQHSAYPANANGNGNGHARSSDTEAAADHNARELKRQKRKKLFIYIAIFVIFQIGVITAFSLTVMKVKTPKFRVRGAAFTNFNAGTPSLQVSMVPQFTVKNTNFGRYKFQTTTVDFFYRGAQIGAVTFANNKAGWLTTKRISSEAVDFNIAATPELSADLSAGVVPITSRAQMRGKVELIFIMKKNRATNMDCSMEIVIATQSIRNIVCK